MPVCHPYRPYEKESPDVCPRCGRGGEDVTLIEIRANKWLCIDCARLEG